MTTLPGETYRLAYPHLSQLENPAYISYGRSHAETCAHHVEHTFNAKRAYIVASRSLSKDTDEVDRLRQALGKRFAGVWPGIAPHTPWDEVLAATADAREKQADCIITIGGGSLVDGAKAMLIFLANGTSTIPEIHEVQKLAPAKMETKAKKSRDIPIAAPTIPLICIPTTLSGGEFTHFAGGTDSTTGLKSIIGHPFCGPRLIIDDPQLTITAPEWVWLSTGVRAIDHSVEVFVRMEQDDAEVDEAALTSFRAVVPNLLRTKNNWTDEQARLKTMLGVPEVLVCLKKGIMVGASHGIGHQLGPLGVGHGQTSCILLPSVMKYNAKVNGAKQERLKAVMWEEPALVEVFKKRGLQQGASDASDALDAIFRELGMPRTLKEVGVGRDKFEQLARNSLQDPCLPANPIPITETSQVMEILHMCAE